MNNRNRWWLTLIALGMVAYCILVLWGQYIDLKIMQHPNIQWVSIIVAVLMGIVGGTALVKELLRQPEDRAPHVLAPAMDNFVSAWRVFWHTNWLLWLYGVFTVVILSGRVLHEVMMRFYMRSIDANQSMPHIWHITLESVTSQLAQSLPSALDHFVPMAPSITTGLSYLLVALLLVLWVLPKVITEVRGDSNRGFFAFCITIAALGCGAVAYDYARLYRSVFSAGTGASLLPESKFTLLSLDIVGFIVVVIIDAALIGGILGSLSRMKRGETPASRTFWQDSVRFSLPLIGIYLIIELLYMVQVVPGIMTSMYVIDRTKPGPMPSYINTLDAVLPIVSLFAMPLLFAPFGIVTRSMSLLQSVGHSFGIWKRNWQQVFVLIALGSFIYCISRLTHLIPIFETSTSWGPVPMGAISAIIATFMGAWILLAVWEFYASSVEEDTCVE